MTSARGRDRRRRRRLRDPLLADEARLGRRPARRARRPDERLHLPFGGPRRPAARLAQPDEDDDELGRALPDARRRGRARDRLARGRLAPPRLVGGADGGDRPPGRLGEDVRPAAGAGLGRRGAAAVPADVHRRRAGRRLSPDRRLHRPEPADLRARGGRPARRRRDRDQYARDRDRARAEPRPWSRDRPGSSRDRDRGGRGRDVRGRARRARRSDRPRRPDGARVPDHAPGRPAARPADDARPLPARLLPRRVRRPGHGRLRAQPRAVGPRRDPAATSTASCSRRTGSASRS